MGNTPQSWFNSSQQTKTWASRLRLNILRRNLSTKCRLLMFIIKYWTKDVCTERFARSPNQDPEAWTTVICWFCALYSHNSTLMNVARPSRKVKKFTVFIQKQFFWKNYYFPLFFFRNSGGKNWWWTYKKWWPFKKTICEFTEFTYEIT